MRGARPRRVRDAGTVGARWPLALCMAAAAAGIAACAVGPSFKRPAPPADSGYGAAPSSGATQAVDVPAGDAQRFLAGMDVPGEWWTLFKSPKLDRLVGQALKGNPNVGAAQAALKQAHELYLAQITSFFPNVQGSFGADRSEYPTGTLTAPTNASSSTYSLYTAQLNLTYMPDVFGATRRAVEMAKAEEQGTRFQLEATYLTLTSNVVVTAVTEASLRGQIKSTRRLLELQHQLTDTAQKQRALGTDSDLDVLAQQSAEAQLAQTLPPLEKQLGQTRDALTALLGKLPAEEPAETFALDDLTLPEDLPVSVPSKLIEQRPDVRQAEENLHAASAAVGVAIADMLPQFAINADLGIERVEARPAVLAVHGILGRRRLVDTDLVRRRRAPAQEARGRRGARSGRRPVSRRRHPGVPECGGHLACAAGRRGCASRQCRCRARDAEDLGTGAPAALPRYDKFRGGDGCGAGVRSGGARGESSASEPIFGYGRAVSVARRRVVESTGGTPL